MQTVRLVGVSRPVCELWKAAVVMDPILRTMLVTEAVNSVALSHPDDCECLACRAAHGEPQALGEILERLEGGLS